LCHFSQTDACGTREADRKRGRLQSSGTGKARDLVQIRDWPRDDIVRFDLQAMASGLGGSRSGKGRERERRIE
jgi:hypothetical protein